MIDHTAWAPMSPLRELRGRTLRSDRESITDVDALAVSRSTVLLVSCKSIPYTYDYDSGDYASVRNVRTYIERSDMEWQQRVRKLQQQPIGDNYNFEGYDIYGVVCTPFVIFVNRPQARVIIEHEGRILRATCGLGELIDFLVVET
jgi:hypothetical protein